MRHFRGDAIRFGAFRSARDVVDDGAMAVLEARYAFSALGHGPLIALAGDKAQLPRGVFARYPQPSS
ncbi:hypothetical protein AU192_16535 [Mycobacterium lehmannii]|uniref:Uncharacterized protein n=1 Tax=Mycobacterium lehmannii TaxID=2048550 RepID=A0A101A125_9MYCO|nr:hypothetical protein AU192_16535 [Mycobacterium lehmannii]